MDSPEPRCSPPLEAEQDQAQNTQTVQQETMAEDLHLKSPISSKRLPDQGTPNDMELQRCSGASADGEESSLDSSGGDEGSSLAKDPFAPECKIPLPVTFAPFDYGWVEPSFIRKRNERERQRVRNVNDGFERLRLHLPLLNNKCKDRRLSKVSRVETLRYAISYIRHLQAMLEE